MTLVVHWWYIPVALVVAAVVLPLQIKDRGDYDFSAGIARAVIFFGCIGAAAAICVGRFWP